MSASAANSSSPTASSSRPHDSGSSQQQQREVITILLDSDDGEQKSSRPSKRARRSSPPDTRDDASLALLIQLQEQEWAMDADEDYAQELDEEYARQLGEEERVHQEMDWGSLKGLRHDAADVTKKERFWEPTIKHVSSFSVADNYSLSLNAVFGPKDELGESILASMTWFVHPLFYEHFPPDKRTTWIMGQGMKDLLEKNGVVLPSFAVPFPVPKIQPSDKVRECMHVKFFILFFNSFCRIVIASANLIPGDWGAQDNSFFIQDLPLLPSTSHDALPSNNPTSTPFLEHLIVALRHMRLNPSVYQPLAKYDFTKTETVKLVFNKPGSWVDGRRAFGQQQRKSDLDYLSGVVSLSEGIRDLGRKKGRSGDSWDIEIKGSSIGRTSEPLMRQLAYAATGAKLTQLPRGKDSALSFNWSPFNMKVVFASEAFVLECRKRSPGYGENHYLTDAHWRACKFQDWFHRASSKRAPLTLMHAKSLVVKHIISSSSSASGEPEVEAFLYVGSANMSVPAWGVLMKPTYEDEPARTRGSHNWEMGVVLRVPGATNDEVEAAIDERVMYQRPLEKYGPADGGAWRKELHVDPRSSAPGN